MLVSGSSFAPLLTLLTLVLDNTTHSGASTGSEAIHWVVGVVVINACQLLIQ